MGKKSKKKSKSKVQIDLSSCDYSDKRILEAMTRQTFQRFALKYSEDVTFGEKMDIEPARLKRRIHAAAGYAPKVRALVGNDCPNIEDLFYIEEEWAKVNALTLTTYDILEDQESISLAAAIWVLDRIAEAGKLTELKRILPKDRIEIIDASVSQYPALWDPLYDEELIWMVAYILRNRNRDCSGIPIKKDGQIKINVIMDAYTSVGKQHQDVPSRGLFEGVMALIPDEAKGTAERHFEEKLWEITERFFRARAVTVREQLRNAEKINALHKRVEQHMEELMSGKPLRAPVNTPLPGMGFPPSGTMQRLDQYMNDPIQYLEYNAGIEQQLEDEANEIAQRISKLLFAVPDMANDDMESYSELLGVEATAPLKGYHPGDPFEMCFALFSLLDHDSDLPWLYFAGTALLRNACSALPWYDGEFDDFDDPVWDYRMSGIVASRPQKPSELPDFYALEYIDKRDDPEFQSYRNLAQIIYNLTGTLMPRDLHRYDSVLSELRHYGITGKKLQTPLLLCMGILGAARHQTNSTYIDFAALEKYAFSEKEVETLEESEPPDGAAEDNALQDENSQLKAELKRLKRALYDAEKAGRDAQTRAALLQQKSAEERQELADLREIVFKQENEVEEVHDASPGIQLPYQVQARTVVFGGHETWAKAIKPMLTGNIRFIDRSMQPNADLIRHAAVVWLQSNSIGHHAYYAIMNIVRAHNIPMRYFTYASAEKCALQLAEADCQYEERNGKHK